MKNKRKNKTKSKRNKKTKSVVKQMRWGGVGTNITDTIFLEIIDLGNCSHVEYNNFIKLYTTDLNDLCINKKTGYRTQNLFQFIHNNGKDRDKYTLKYTLIYLYKESKTENITKHIIAFALINTSEFESYKIISLHLLCSHRDSDSKLYKIDKPLGIYLLDYLYDYYNIYKTEVILKIEPATPELIPYYTKWKTPNISVDNLSITAGYLIYGNIKLITDNTLNHLFGFEIERIKYIMELLQLTKFPEIVYRLSGKDRVEKIKTFLKIKVLNNEYEDQILKLIDLIKFSSLEEIKDIFI